MCSGQVYIWDSLDALSHYIVLMMGTETVPERVLILNHLTWLIAQEDFTNVSRRESFTSYTIRAIHSKSNKLSNSME